MRALVIGYGSIGQRHAGLLTDLGCDVGVVSRRAVGHPRVFADLKRTLVDWRPDYTVIADRTSEHYGTVATLAAAGYAGRVLVEKPLFHCVKPLPAHQFSHARVAFQFRCDPLLKRLRGLVRESRPLAATLYVGSYLPGWRPGVDYRRSYSAFRDGGGGVLRDLSHELDCVLWLFGPWIRLTAAGGHISPLEIDSDDAFTVLMETATCALVTVHLNYLDRVPRREIVVNTDRHTIRVDQIARTLAVDGCVDAYEGTRDDAYRAEHQAMIEGHVDALCSLEDGMETVATIEAAERAAASRAWVSR